MLKTLFDSEEARQEDLERLLRLNNISKEEFPFKWLCTTDFFRAPAAAKHHCNYYGGLYDHSRNVFQQLARFTQLGLCTWTRSSSPLIIGMLHDATKIGAYQTFQEKNPLTGELEYGYTHKVDQIKFSEIHGMDSVLKIEDYMYLTTEERLCIRFHMGAYETDAWDEYDEAIRAFPNVLWTHQADMIASKLMENAR